MFNPSQDTNVSSSVYDGRAALQELDATKSGVRGLVQSVPVIDLREVDHAAVVANVRRAAADWGLFQVTGHSVPQELVAAAQSMVRTLFHDADGGEGTLKGRLYSRDPNKAVRYNTNFDSFESPVTNWQDTLYIITDPEVPGALGELPKNGRVLWLRKTFEAHAGYLVRIAIRGTWPQGKLLGRHRLQSGPDMLACHYYPPCPEPEHAIGMVRHSDWGFLTVLLQDQIGGLQVLHNDTWVDVVPIPGAFVVILGDMLQMVSNDNFTSCEHRVVAKRTGPRVSIASIPTQAGSTRNYGPVKELLSHTRPPLYKETLASVYRKHCASIGLGNKGVHDFQI
ncbi:unnamed protein product [Urochloa decumbens]|uniref:Fe2OG dioxygenase domain-containing protein n=1 Tax=Urochloa decumbens TaxID=240449 RepID=A0ABC8VZV8_9POAL